MKGVDRRTALAAVATSGLAVGCTRRDPEAGPRTESDQNLSGPLTDARVASTFALPKNAPFPTFDPFLFCVHHRDDYPRGNGRFGPAVSLSGRNLGQDFSAKDGFSMYHGLEVAGFPRHPHRGFETVTVVRRGRLDHSDSLGARARYGDGDVQWLTAGSGIEHAEMFPLLSAQDDNPLDLFQIWLNLPARSKFAPAAFSMLWASTIPEQEFVDARGLKTRVTVRGGQLEDLKAHGTPPHSWASDPNNGVAIVTLELSRGATFRLSGSLPGVTRALYAISGNKIELGSALLDAGQGARLDSHLPITLRATEGAAELLLLQGRPIGEPVKRRGPFVMNTEAELGRAFLDYRETQFGGWPWETSGPVHGSDPARFALRPGGALERPT